MGGVLEGAAAVGAGGESQEPAAGGVAAVGFLHGVDRVEEVFGGVVGSDDADLAVAEGTAVVEVGCDVAAVEISGFLAPRGG